MFSRTDKQRLDERISELNSHMGGDAALLRGILTEIAYELRDAWVEIERLEDLIRRT